MRYNEIVEAVSYTNILSRANVQVHKALEQFITELIRDFRKQGIQSRRHQLGYHRYLDNATGHKPFDQEEFDRANRDWSVDADYIGDYLHQLIPDPETANFSPVYAVMVKISDALTKIVQDEIRTQYGDRVYLHKNKMEQAVSNIKVKVWWKTLNNRNVLGQYIGQHRVANGIETALYIIIDRNRWTDWLREEISYRVSGDITDTSKFLNSIVNTFIHEYQHLIQDISGPGKYTRQITKPGSIPDHTYLGVLARTSEIDAHATAAAAERIHHILSWEHGRHARYSGYHTGQTDWDASRISPEDWNERVKEELRYVIDNIPEKDYQKYLKYLSARAEYDIDPAVKDQELALIKKRFLSTYVKRLQAYLRDTESGKITIPSLKDKLPQE